LIIDFKVLVLSLLTLLADHTAVSTHRFPFCGCQVAWWHVGSRLPTYMSRVRVPPRHYCAVALGKLLTPVCLCH